MLRLSTVSRKQEGARYILVLAKMTTLQCHFKSFTNQHITASYKIFSLTYRTHFRGLFGGDRLGDDGVRSRGEWGTIVGGVKVRSSRISCYAIRN